jgi:Flp pilus assembly protein TadB
MSKSRMTSNDDSAAGLRFSLARRLMRSASALAVTAVQRWAWSTLTAPIALTVVAVVAYLLHRSGSYARLGVALDSLLVTDSAILDPDTPAPCTPQRRFDQADFRYR